MKTNATQPKRPTRGTHPRLTTTRTPDPLQREVTRRRHYTDFLALAFYPGMNPRRTHTAA